MGQPIVIEIAAVTAAAERALGAVASKLTAVLGVGALAGFLKHAIDTADAAGKLAQKVGTAVESITALTYAAKQGDVEVSELQVSMKFLGNAMVDAAEKAGEARKAFQDAGIAFANQDGTLRNTQEVLADLADAFQRMPDGAQKTAIATQLMGRSAQDLIPWLNEGSAAMKEAAEEARLFGVVVDRTFAAQADRFNDNLGRIKAIFEGIALIVVDKLLPPLNAFLEMLIDVYKELKGVLDELAETDAGQTVLSLIEEVLLLLPELLMWFKALGAYLGTFFGILAAGGSVLEANLAAMDRWDEVFEDGERRIDAVRAAWAKLTQEQEQARVRFVPASEAIRLRAQLLGEEVRAERALAMTALGRQVRESMAADALRAQLATLQQLQRELEARKPEIGLWAEGGQVLEPQASIDWKREQLELERKRLQVVQQLREFEAGESFTGRMRENLRTLSDEWSALSINIADALTNGIQTAVDGVSDSIMGMIDGTLTWGQAFQQVARSIIADLIRVVVQWVAQMTVMRALQSLFHKQRVTEATIEAGAKAPVALFDSISSWGVAAAVGAAALAAALGAFAQGGVVPGGEQLIRVNEGGKSEYVLRAAAVEKYGLAFLDALNAGAIGALNLGAVLPGYLPQAVSGSSSATPLPGLRSGTAAPSVNVAPAPVSVAVLNNEGQLRRFLESTEGRRLVVDAVSGHRVDLGMG